MFSFEEFQFEHLPLASTVKPTIEAHGNPCIFFENVASVPNPSFCQQRDSRQLLWFLVSDSEPVKGKGVEFQCWLLGVRVPERSAASRIPLPENRSGMPGFVCRVSGVGFRVSDFGFKVSGVGSQISGVGFRVSSVGFQVSGFRFRVSGFGSGPGTRWCGSPRRMTNHAP